MRLRAGKLDLHPPPLKKKQRIQNEKIKQYWESYAGDKRNLKAFLHRAGSWANQNYIVKDLEGNKLITLFLKPASRSLICPTLPERVPSPPKPSSSFFVRKKQLFFVIQLFNNDITRYLVKNSEYAVTLKCDKYTL